MTDHQTTGYRSMTPEELRQENLRAARNMITLHGRDMAVTRCKNYVKAKGDNVAQFAAILDLLESGEV